MSYGWVLSITFSVDRPGLFDLKGKAKWDSWKAYSGKLNRHKECFWIISLKTQSVMFYFVQISWVARINHVMHFLIR